MFYCWEDDHPIKPAKPFGLHVFTTKHYDCVLRREQGSISWKDVLIEKAHRKKEGKIVLWICLYGVKFQAAGDPASFYSEGWWGFGFVFILFFPSLSFLSPSPLPLREHNTWPLFKAIKLQSRAGWSTGLSICEKSSFIWLQSNQTCKTCKSDSEWEFKKQNFPLRKEK